MTIDGQSVSFHTVDEYIKLRSLMKREVDSTPTYRLAATDKGT